MKLLLKEKKEYVKGKKKILGREKAMQEIILNGCEKAIALTAESSTRDDDASKNMYPSKSLTLSKFMSKLNQLKA